MSNYLNLLDRLRPQQPADAGWGQAAVDGYMKGVHLNHVQQDRVQALEERARKHAAEDRAKQEERLKFGMGQAKSMAEAGDLVGAKETINALTPLTNQLYPELNAKPILGGKRLLDAGTYDDKGRLTLDPDSELANMGIDQIRSKLTFDRNGVQFKEQGYLTPESVSRIHGTLGIKPDFKNFSDTDPLYKVTPGLAPQMVRPGTPKTAPYKPEWDSYIAPDGTKYQYDRNNPSQKTVVGQTVPPGRQESTRPSAAEAKLLVGEAPKPADFGVLTPAEIRQRAEAEAKRQAGPLGDKSPQYAALYKDALGAIEGGNKRAQALYRQASQQYTESLRQVMQTGQPPAEQQSSTANDPFAESTRRMGILERAIAGKISPEQAAEMLTGKP